MIKEGTAGRQLYPIALPAKDAPLGLIARLSLEEAEEIAFDPSSSTSQDSTQDAKPSKKRPSPSSRPTSESQPHSSSSSSGSSRPSTPSDDDIGTYCIASPSFFLPTSHYAEFSTPAPRSRRSFLPAL
ncbi:hypothetical protein M422DRAFT_276859 [Sphaerobolus stellatus SS14]|uniref:Uncharacterized protein n=1 Tax=Sphaerobolus stellatus (strain SS14) TaxID=990650 RepID=A0A0C9UC57_SPHS4|nr:hypothetical protein M422DRAFT_276859 [Sphaerobolus stellatus SS14]